MVIKVIYWGYHQEKTYLGLRQRDGGGGGGERRGGIVLGGGAVLPYKC